MSLSIYLDDCAFSYRLRQLLIEAGYDVQIPADVTPSLTGVANEIHFTHTKIVDRIILTFNPKDFADLHQISPNHTGIFAVYQDNDPTRDMSYINIVRDLADLENSGITIAQGFWSLNVYHRITLNRNSILLVGQPVKILISNSGLSGLGPNQ